MKRYRIELSFSELFVDIQDIGDDKLVTVHGGEMPHIGCAVMSIPRPSLTGDGSISATSSVLNVTGHKDEEICRRIAEKIAASENCTVVCTGGFHVDNITEEQIKELFVKLSSFILKG